MGNRVAGTARYRAALACVCALVFLSGIAGAGQILHVYTWSDYFAPDVIEAFEQENDCRVSFDYFDSGEAAYAKLKAIGGGYDVITPQTYMAAILYKQEMAMPLDHSLIPNITYIDPEFPGYIEDTTLAYSIPYTRAVAGVGYNATRVRPEDTGSWDIFANPAYTKRMTMLNDMRETLGAALKKLGFSLNTTDDDELRQAGDQLIAWKKNLAKFDVDEAKLGLHSGEFTAVHSYNGDIGLVMQDNPDIGFFVPEEGASFGVDVFVVDAASRSPELAHAFINHLLDPDMAAANMEYMRYYMPVPDAVAKLPEELRNSPAFQVPREVMRRSEVIRDLGPDHDKYIREWSRVKAAE
ncbi:MAG: spermidine/putrescine ABC transporter substrate-binding protein [Planctomycetaceae bacterium]|nr:spermidine/putrescine ABC transporter substrate-binding protein [Planctomycetaceae bacterium]